MSQEGELAACAATLEGTIPVESSRTPKGEGPLELTQKAEEGQSGPLASREVAGPAEVAPENAWGPELGTSVKSGRYSALRPAGSVSDLSISQTKQE